MPDADRYDEPYSQLDWTGRIKLTANIQMTAEVRNLTNTMRSNVQTTPQGDFVRDTSLYGRTAFVGFSFKF